MSYKTASETPPRSTTPTNPHISHSRPFRVARGPYGLTVLRGTPTRLIPKPADPDSWARHRLRARRAQISHCISVRFCQWMSRKGATHHESTSPQSGITPIDGASNIPRYAISSLHSALNFCEELGVCGLSPLVNRTDCPSMRNTQHVGTGAPQRSRIASRAHASIFGQILTGLATLGLGSAVGDQVRQEEVCSHLIPVCP
jgi:hypothetical protein